MQEQIVQELIAQERIVQERIVQERRFSAASDTFKRALAPVGIAASRKRRPKPYQITDRNHPTAWTPKIAGNEGGRGFSA
jgi:hypothetical protein